VALIYYRRRSLLTVAAGVVGGVSDPSLLAGLSARPTGGDSADA